MLRMAIDECVYYVHPVYDLYAADKNGNVLHIIEKVPRKGCEQRNGYIKCMVREYGGRQKGMFVHRFVWECFNGVIPEGKVIDHINDDKKDNRLCNLQLITQQQNCEKSAKNRDYTYTAKNHENRKCVKATNIITEEVSYFYSMYAVQQHIGINAGIVKMVGEKINNCKTGVSKKDGCKYKFEYVKQDDLPDDYKKSANKRPRKWSDEERKKLQKEHSKKWQQKEYQCPRCGRTYKNNYRYLHKKFCK